MTFGDQVPGETLSVAFFFALPVTFGFFVAFRMPLLTVIAAEVAVASLKPDVPATTRTARDLPRSPATGVYDEAVADATGVPATSHW